MLGALHADYLTKLNIKPINEISQSMRKKEKG